jgi:hypothetical protein
MATDPAFAVGVLALVARRAPSGVRLLLLAIATVDDVLASVVMPPATAATWHGRRRARAACRSPWRAGVELPRYGRTCRSEPRLVRDVAFGHPPALAGVALALLTRSAGSPAAT